MLLPMNLQTCFPRYSDFDPLVPVWCITPNEGRCIHRFFDTSPISPSGRYLAVFRLPFEDRQPRPGDSGQVCVVDLETGKERVVAETQGWEPQMGANMNWGGSDHVIFFNDVDASTWQPFAWKLDPLTGARQRMEGTVYHVSPDGRWLISANMTTMRITQPGYGVVAPKEYIRRNIGPASDDGFYLTDAQTGKSHLLLSISDIVERARPRVIIENPLQQEIYGFHSKFNHQGNRLMMSLRWFPTSVRTRGYFSRAGCTTSSVPPVSRIGRFLYFLEGRNPSRPFLRNFLRRLTDVDRLKVRWLWATGQLEWNAFALAYSEVRYAWVTSRIDGTLLHCAVGPEQWEKGGHHATWCPNGERISMNLDIDREGCVRFVESGADGAYLRKMNDTVVGSGHPTVFPDGRHILTDTYAADKIAFGDGTVPLRWIDLATSKEQTLVRINVRTPSDDVVLRVDAHPAWDRTWRYITFNAFVGGTRRVFIADMSHLL